MVIKTEVKITTFIQKDGYRSNNSSSADCSGTTDRKRDRVNAAFVLQDR